MFLKTIVRAGVLIGALVAGHGAATSPTIPIHSPDVAPGQTFALDMPGLGEGFTWSVDLEGLSPGSDIIRLEVDVPQPGALLPTFQVYAGDGVPGFSGYRAIFDLEVNQTPGTWTEVQFDEYIYHNYLFVTLDPGLRTFDVVLVGLPNGDRVAPAGAYALVAIGDVVPAVPVPAPAVLLIGAVAAIAGLRWRKA